MERTAVTCDEHFVNHTANKFFTKCSQDHPLTCEGVDPLMKTACDKCVWYDPFQVTGVDPKLEKS